MLYHCGTFKFSFPFLCVYTIDMTNQICMNTLVLLTIALFRLVCEYFDLGVLFINLHLARPFMY